MANVGIVERESWTKQALCAGHPDRRAWFPEEYRSAGPARAVCRVCPVRSECLTYAITTGQDDGIWGGTTPQERRRLRRAARSEIKVVDESEPLQLLASR